MIGGHIQELEAYVNAQLRLYLCANGWMFPRMKFVGGSNFVILLFTRILTSHISQSYRTSKCSEHFKDEKPYANYNVSWIKLVIN